VDFIYEFGFGDFGDWGGEFHGADLAFELAAQGIGEGKEMAGGKRRDVALGQLGFDLFELFADVVDAGLDIGQPFLCEVFAQDGLVIMDVELELAAPIHTCGLGDLKLFRNANEAPAVGAEEYETLLFFDVIHSF